MPPQPIKKRDNRLQIGKAILYLDGLTFARCRRLIEPMLDLDNPATPATDDCEAPPSQRAELSQRSLINSIAMRSLEMAQ
jgi:hypothetical protein